MSYSAAECNTKDCPTDRQKSTRLGLEPMPQHDTLLEETLQKSHPEISLTKREREILGMIVNGMTNRQIAQALHRTERTVEYHRNHLMHKFKATTAAALVKRAILSGMA